MQWKIGDRYESGLQRSERCSRVLLGECSSLGTLPKRFGRDGYLQPGRIVPYGGTARRPVIRAAVMVD